MATNNHNEGRGLDITELPTDEYPVLRESDLLAAQEAAEMDRASHASAEPTDEPVNAASSLAQLEADVSRLHGKWQSIETDFKKRETQIVLLNEEIRTREAAIAKLIADLEREAVALDTAEQRLEGKDAEIVTLVAERHARDDRIAALSKDLADAEIAHKDTLQKVARAEAEAARLDELLRQEQAAAAGVAERNRQALADQERLQGKLQDLEIYINGRHDRWSALNSELAAQKHALLDLEEKVEARDAVIAQHDEEKRQLAAALHDLERQCSELAGRRKEREEAYDELQKNLAAHFAQAEQLKTEYAHRTKDTDLAVSTLGKRVDELEKDLAERSQQLQALRDDLQTSDDLRRLAQEHLSERTAQLASTQEALDRQSQRAERLETERDAAQQESTRIRTELDALSAHAMELGRLRGEAAGETQHLKLALAAQQKLVARLETEIRAKQATVDVLERSVERITDLGASLAALDQQMNGGGDGNVDVLLDDERNGNIVDVGERTRIEAGRKLVVTIGGRAFDYPLSKKQVTIGRGHDSDIRIASHFISRIHARISTDAATTVIEDAGSKNGVVVNSQRVRRRVLRDGDVVNLGDDSSLRFVDATH
jgi:chromosome segregation ATPase